MLLGVDVGGTFTDAVLAVGGRLVTAKAPTTPEDHSDGVLIAAVQAATASVGVIRELEALAEMDYSLLTGRRRHAPPGAAGGEPGARGRNLLDAEEELPPTARGTLGTGQRLRIETPGGGGHG